MENTIQKINKFFSELKSLINVKGLLFLFVWAFCVNLVLETLARFQANGVITGNIWGGIVAIFTRPYTILHGTLFVMFTLSIALFFKRKYLVLIIVSFIWIVLALTDCILLAYRVTPFSSADFQLVDDAMQIITKYLSKSTIIYCILALILVLTLFIIIAIKAPKERCRNIKRALLTVFLTFSVTFISDTVGKASDLLDKEFPNLANAYLDNGFAYCFVTSIFDVGIDKPSEYSENMIEDIIDNDALQDSTHRPVSTELNYEDPNIIFLQLESFFDLTSVSDLKLSEDPIPFFRSLLDSCPSGYLSMPCIGAGTANTEFEVLTGISIDFFGPGEYPYKTILKDTACESLAFNLHDNGYTTHAIHNNRASFYSRHKIFANLGFDEFTPIELMNVEEYTPNGWAKDKILTEEIMHILNTTENRDFIYAISVQGHGKYPSTQLIENPEIQLLEYADESKKYGIEYYANQLFEMDCFLKELITTLESYDEPVILVAYGDHLPGLGFSEEDLVNNNLLQTQYIIWTNQDDPLTMSDKDMEAFQLSSHLCKYLGIDTGLINAYHQTYQDEDTETYLSELEALAYDVLYGEHYVYNDESIYTKSDMKYGVTTVEITSVEQDPKYESIINISGNYFTPYSRIYIDGEKISTLFVNENLLLGNVTDYDSEDEVTVLVKQSNNGSLILQTSNEIIYTVEYSEEYQLYGEDYENNNNNFFEEDVVPDDIGAMIEEGF